MDPCAAKPQDTVPATASALPPSRQPQTSKLTKGEARRKLEAMALTLPPSRWQHEEPDLAGFLAPKQHPDQLSGGWKRFFHVDGRAYYHHPDLAQTQWELPPEHKQLLQVPPMQSNVSFRFEQQHHQLQSSHLFENSGAMTMHGHNVAMMQHVHEVCDHCWMTGGKHKKKCPKTFVHETAQQREKRLKQEERWRDQELGSEYVDVEKQTEKTFTEYVPSRLKHIGGLKAHPDPVTETSALNSIQSPPITYKLKIPQSVILGGCLTNLQLESILYACDQHQHMLPCDQSAGETPVRAGFFMGDGPGVGKGRQIAGIVMENYLRSRKKAVWISVGPDLLEDARRDLRDIGAGAIKVHDLKDWPAGQNLQLEKACQTGVLFSTYTLLARGIKAKAGAAVDDVQVQDMSRLKQIIDWCGPGFDGVIAFDEAHKAKNMTMKDPRKKSRKRSEQDVEIDPDAAVEESGTGEQIEGTNSAQAVLLLQKQLPNARVVYVSATGASEPEHLLYATRLGLWGTRTSFENAMDFAKEIKDGGPSAMELLAMQMKQSGKYLARSLSFKGATFEVVEVQLTQDFEDMYDKSVELWRDLMRDFERGFKVACDTAKKKVGPDGKPVKLSKRSLRQRLLGAHQRFFGQMLMAAKVDETVRLSQEAVEEGKCVVIGIQNTGEAGLTDESGAEGCSAASHILRSVIKHMEEYVGTDNMERLLERLEELQLPMNPLDDLIDRLGGPRRVAEMTGRKFRQVCEKNEWVIEKRTKCKDSEDAVNIQERKKFMAGKKLVAIISDAASTGISLQADRRVRNDRRRVHITLQLPWSADKAVQQMGRSHRSNQSSAPEFKLMMTPIGGEWRFASAVAERLQQLGAITRGDRRASGGMGLTTFAVDGIFGLEAIQEFQESLKLKRIWRNMDVQFLDPNAKAEEMDGESKQKFKIFATEAIAAFEDTGLQIEKTIRLPINTFLNRLLGLKLKLQTQVFSYWHEIMVELIREAKKTGKFQEGILDIGSKLEIQEEHVLFEDANTGMKTCLNKLVGDRGVSWRKAKKLLKDQVEDYSGFYRRTKNKDGRSTMALKQDEYNIFLALEKKQLVKTKGQQVFISVQPHSGYRPDEISRADLRNRCDKLSDEDAEKQWNRVYDMSKDRCSCKQCEMPATCELKKRMQTHHILTGSVLPFWRSIKEQMLSYAKKHGDLDEDDGEGEWGVKVVRVETSDDRRLVGISIPNELADDIKNSIARIARNLGYDSNLDLKGEPTTSANAAQMAVDNSNDVAGEEISMSAAGDVTSSGVEGDKAQAEAENIDSEMWKETVEGTLNDSHLHEEGADDEDVQPGPLLVMADETEDEEEGLEDAKAESRIHEAEQSDQVGAQEVEAQPQQALLNVGDNSCVDMKDATDMEVSKELACESGQENGDADGIVLKNVDVPCSIAQDGHDEVGADSTNAELTGAQVSIVVEQAAGDETEDDSDVEVQMNSGQEQAQELHPDAAIDSSVNQEITIEVEEILSSEDVQSDGKPRSRDSILSKSETPAKLLIPESSAAYLVEPNQGPAKISRKNVMLDDNNASAVHSQSPTGESMRTSEHQVESAGGSNRRASSAKVSLNARNPARDSDGSGVEDDAGDEMKMHDVETKQQLKKLVEQSEELRTACAESTAAKIEELQASGLWEHDDEAEEFFAQGLKIIEDARRRDECTRRRYNPSKDKSNQKGKVAASKSLSRSGRLLKKTDRYAPPDEDNCTDYEGGTETESDGDDGAEDEAKGQSSKAVRSRRRQSSEQDGKVRIRKARAPRKKQDASAVMVDRTLKDDVNAQKVCFDATGKDALKEMAAAFMSGLLGRPELVGTMSERAVKVAIRSWIPRLGGIGESMRGSGTPGPSLSVPKQPLKRQIKLLHPSCCSGVLKSISNSGLRRVEAILGFFCQSLVHQVAGIALARGSKVVSRSSLMDPGKGVENLKDPTLRKLLSLEPLPDPVPHPDAHKFTCGADGDVFSSDLNATPRPVHQTSEKQQQDKAGGKNTMERERSPEETSKDREQIARDVELASGHEHLTIDHVVEKDYNSVALGAPVQREQSPGASDNEGDKTESETDIDKDEPDNEECEDNISNGDLTEVDNMTEEEEEEDGGMFFSDDFRNRSHYCSSKCKFHNKYQPDEFMLCCEGCDEWFHGRCLGLKEGTIADEQVWVCSQDCFDDLPLALRKKEVVVRAPKRQHKKHELKSETKGKKEKTEKGEDQATAVKGPRGRPRKATGQPSEVEEEMLGAEWSEEYMPRFQSLREQPPVAIDDRLVGRMIMQKLATPEGWFPAKIKHIYQGKKKAKCILSYSRKLTNGLMQGEREAVLDLTEYGKEGKGKSWLLLEEISIPPAKPEALYCKKSCKLGRENGEEHFMIFCEGCAVWFHGPCVGVELGDLGEDTVWVCCQKCKYDLPRNLRSEALVGNSFKKQKSAGTACAARVIKTLPALAQLEDDSDDDIPILQRPAAKRSRKAAASDQLSAPAAEVEQAADESEDDEPIMGQESVSVTSIILEPLATFVGATRMGKRDALNAVLSHIKANNLFDAEDELYILLDERLKTLDPRFVNRKRFKLRKLAKIVAKYIVGKDEREPAAAEETKEQPGSGDTESGDRGGDVKSWVGMTVAEVAKLLVGKQRIRKFFPAHGWFDGNILSFDDDTGKFMLRYDDGDEETASIAEVSKYLPKNQQSLAKSYVAWLEVKSTKTDRSAGCKDRANSSNHVDETPTSSSLMDEKQPCSLNDTESPSPSSSKLAHFVHEPPSGNADAPLFHVDTVEPVPPEVMPTPPVLQAASARANSPKGAESPQMVQYNWKKRLGFNADNSPALNDRPANSGEPVSATQNPIPAKLAHEEAGVCGEQSPCNKKRRLVVDSDDDEGQTVATTGQGEFMQSTLCSASSSMPPKNTPGSEETGIAVPSDAHTLNALRRADEVKHAHAVLSPKRKIMDEDSVKGPIADEQRACKKGCMVSHAMDEVDDGNIFPEQQQMASAVNNTDVEDDDIGDLDLDALEAQGTDNSVSALHHVQQQSTLGPASQAEALPEEDDDYDDGLDGLTMEEIAEIERRALGGP